jgi:hypothetical protein
MDLETILQFLQPIAYLITDATVSNQQASEPVRNAKGKAAAQ